MGWFGGVILQTYHRVPGDYEDITVGSEAVGLSHGKVQPTRGLFAGLSAQAALLSLEGGDLRIRLDGGLPTADHGHILVSGDALTLTGTQSLYQFRAVRSGEVNGILRVTYFY